MGPGRWNAISETGEVGEAIPLHFRGGCYASGHLAEAGADLVAGEITDYGKPIYSVALIDLKNRKVAGVVQTRTTGQKAALGVKHKTKDFVTWLRLTTMTTSWQLGRMGDLFMPSTSEFMK